MSIGSSAKVAEVTYNTSIKSLPTWRAEKLAHQRLYTKHKSPLRRAFKFARSYSGFSYLHSDASRLEISNSTYESCSEAVGSTPRRARALQLSLGLLDGFVRATLHFAAACLVSWSSLGPAFALTIDLPSTDVSKEQYERAIKSHSSRSNLPSKGEAEMLLQLDKDLFTDDAWEGMKTILEVANYVDSRLDAEKEPGCSSCTSNRMMLEKAWQTIANEYYDPTGSFSQAKWAKELLIALQASGGLLQTKQATYNAMQSMVASLNDRYTEFLPPSQFRKALRRPIPREREYLEQQYTGIGLQLGRHSSRGGWLVEGPLAESPAEESGILPGQRVVEIDGYPSDLLTPLEIAALMRGPAGSSVDLTLADNKPHSKTWSLELERRSLPQPPMKVDIVPGPRGPVQYIRVHYFSGETSRQFSQALKSAEGDGRYGILIDLRNNPGGVFEEAISMASMVLGDRCLIAQTVRNSEVIDAVFRVGSLSKQVFPKQVPRLTSLPIAIIVNHGSASASEVFAGALQDNNRASLVGEQSFGKGVVQHYFPFEDGSGLKVTVMKYLTPSGFDISKRGGVIPTISCNDYPHPGRVSPTSDTCILQALKTLEF